MLEQPVLDADLELLLIQGAKQRHLGTGEVLLDAGEEPNCIWWVQRGSLRSLMQLPPRQEWRTVERHGAGTLVGWLGVVALKVGEGLVGGTLARVYITCTASEDALAAFVG